MKFRYKLNYTDIYQTDEIRKQSELHIIYYIPVLNVAVNGYALIYYCMACEKTMRILLGKQVNKILVCKD
jgi:hypothetical protein